MESPVSLPDSATQHPPVMPRPLIAPPTAWPTVLGIFCIVFGSAGLLISLWGAVAPLVITSWPSFGAGFDPMAGITQWRGWLVAQNIASICVASLLMAGGIMLLRRCKASRTILRAWAMVKIILVVAASILGSMISTSQLAAIQQAGVMPTGTQNLIAVVNWIGVALGVLWGWALPAFLLIWLARKSVRAEIASW